MGHGALLVGRAEGSGAPAPCRCDAGRQGLRRGAGGAGGQARRRHGRAVRRPQGRHPRGEEADRGGEGRLQARAGEGRTTRERVARERATAPRRPGRLAVRLLRRAAAASVLVLAGCSSLPSLPSLNPVDWFTSKSTGPKPAELPALSNPQGVKTLWS